MVSTNISISIPRYHLTEKLYAGSRTVVYRGIRACDQQAVVVKLLNHDYPTFDELLQFRNQYTIAKALEIPGIIRTYSLESYNNSYALVMEDYGGISLREYLQVHPINIKEFLTLALQLADILHSLSQNRVIHKDIKPANILIHPETKQIKLIDFSIASLLPKETQEIKNPNVLEGTLAYISPEQTGRMNRGIDYRSDFYSLGVTLYEILTGELPFISDDAMELVHCHIAKMPSAIGNREEIPQILSNIILKLMAKNAEDRYQSALGLKYDLENCLQQLKEIGKIKPFKIAQRDICDRFIIPEKLYGREQEVQTLLDAFKRVSDGQTEMMLVAGYSGIGKTAVVNEVHKPIVKQRGYFVKGKFDQFNRNIPFSAFVQAFRDLMGQLLTESTDLIQQWKKKILEAVGENGEVIIEVIPELERIIGKQPPAQILSGSAAQNRFNLLFQKFIAVFTSPEHPLVMFLDDLQWADSASIQLIKLLMEDQKHLLLLGAYRDNEVSPAHPFMLMVEELQKTGATVNTITLKPLGFKDTNNLVADTLNCSTELSQSLTELIVRKTQGNPFFTTQFLKALHEDGHIIFNDEQGYWECDIVKINTLSLTSDVVEFMAQQLQKLPEKTQNILKLAACIGNQFDLETLAIVSQQSSADTATDLWKALQEGLILPQTQIYKFYLSQNESNGNIDHNERVSYRFLHDRVQQAAYSLIPEKQKQATHLKIGQLLLQDISPVAREERIFELVNQFNYGVGLITEQIEKDELAQLNLIASRKARASIAYHAAYEYANIGLSLLGAKAWQQQYEMTLALHELAAEVASLLGQFEQMDRWIAAVIHDAKTPLDQVQVYQVKIQALTSHNEFLEAIATGKSVLQLLGVTLSDSPTLEDIQPISQEINALIGDRSIEELIHLPKMTDTEQLAIMRMAAGITSPCYMTGSMLYFLIVALQVKWSVEYGNSPFSAYCYAGYAFQLRILWQEMIGVQEFGELAYNLALTPEVKNILPAVSVLIGGFVRHWTAHLQETLSILQQGYNAGLETGNLEFLGYDVAFFCLNSYWCGQHLTELEPLIHGYHQQLCDLNQVTTANCCLIYWQAVLILLGQSENKIPLRQDSYEETIVAEAKASNDFFRLCQFYLYRFTLSFLLQDIAKAEKDAAQTRQYLAGCMGSMVEPILYFYDSLTVLTKLSESNAESDAQWQQVQENQAKLQKWEAHAPMNHLHKYRLVEAEKYRVLGKNYEAGDLYDKAISGAKENNYIQEEALANELAAKFHLKWGKEKVASGYMQEAYYCYAKWGAKAKTDDLEKRYPQLLKPILQQRQFNLNPWKTITTIAPNSISHSTHTSTAGHTNISDTLDFTSILKAAQAISSSIELDELIAQLTKIILENSGAKKSVLILPQGHCFVVRSITYISSQNNPQSEIVTALVNESIETHEDIPKNIINYVRNTQEMVAINDCKTNIPGMISEYLLTHQPKSILCTPIIHHGRLTGILYLENQLTSGVFTPERLQVIKLLSSQAAISLENAKLYQQAQQALQDLQQAQLQIVQSEKMSALGNLVAGVAHEMNNPLGFISATLKQTKPTFLEVVEHLELYQETFLEKTEEIIDHAEEIDLDFTLEDLPEMIDSMVMACDRLKNISTSLRTFSRADQDHKVPFNIHEGIESTLLILKHRLKANENRPGIQVIAEYGDLPQIQCFPGQLNQVIMNILANAIDALDESNQGRNFEEIRQNPNQITVSTSIENNHAKISITDNGKGMSEAVKSKIFDHLFTTKAVGKGTGLGLAIARQIVEEKHGGTIEVNSILGQGTEFIIRLPV
jgi:predicted ATPase/signal transduction histidine kinase